MIKGERGAWTDNFILKILFGIVIVNLIRVPRPDHVSGSVKLSEVRTAVRSQPGALHADKYLHDQ
jgi:hypothetical protein